MWWARLKPGESECEVESESTGGGGGLLLGVPPDACCAVASLFLPELPGLPCCLGPFIFLAPAAPLPFPIACPCPFIALIAVMLIAMGGGYIPGGIAIPGAIASPGIPIILVGCPPIMLAPSVKLDPAAPPGAWAEAPSDRAGGLLSLRVPCTGVGSNVFAGGWSPS